MTDIRALIQDLRAHAPEAPSPCAAFMRKAATALERFDGIVVVRGAPLAISEFDPPREEPDAIVR